MDIEKAVVVTDGKQWEKDIPDLGDLEVLVAPWENPAFERMVAKAIRALPPAMRVDGAVEPSAYYRIVGTAIAKTVLFDWKNLKSGGVDKPFDQALALQLLTDPKAKPFRDGVVVAARRMQLGVKQEEEQLLGNSQTSSLGSENGEALSKD